MHSPEKTMKARLWHASRSARGEAWNAAYDALESVLTQTPMSELDWIPKESWDAWPVSGDDLALAKAGRTAWPTS